MLNNTLQTRKSERGTRSEKRKEIYKETGQISVLVDRLGSPNRCFALSGQAGSQYGR